MSRPTMQMFWSLALAASVVSSSCSPGDEPPNIERLFIEQEPARSVLLVTLDTTRHDFIGAYGTPGMVFTPRTDALAKRGLVFENAISTAPFTGPAHASILTGQYPSTHGIIYNGSRVKAEIPTDSISLAEHLAARGFRTGAVVSNGVLHRRYGFSRGFDTYHFHNEPQLTDQGGDSAGVRKLAVEFLDGVGSERFFLWVHFIEPHLPYVVSDEVGDLFQLQDRDVPIEVAKELPVHRLRRAYGADLFEADREVGAILDHLDTLGLTEEVLIVLTADHGEYLHEHGLLDHSRLYDHVLHVPLIVAGPGVVPGGRRQDLVSVIDIPDTITDGLGTGPVPSSQGTSQWRRSDGFDPDRAVFAEWRNFKLVLEPDNVNPKTDFLVGVQQGMTKLILPVLAPEHRQLFDRSVDPLEHTNRVRSRPELAAHLANLHHQHVSQDLPRGILGVDSVDIDDTALNMLRELGYVE